MGEKSSMPASMVSLLSFMISVAVNIAFVSFASRAYEVPSDCVLAGVLLCLTGYSDGTPSTQTKVGVWPFLPTNPTTFVDNKSLCFGLIGFNSSAVIGSFINSVFIPNNFRLGRGRVLYLAGNSDTALGGSAYATYFFEEL